MTILCGIDFSPASTYAAELCALLANVHNEPLVLVHAISAVAVPDVYVSDTLLDEMRGSAERALQELAARLGDDSGRVSSHTAVGAADEVILSEARKRDVRLVALGSVGHRGMKWLLGSTADRVVARAHVPVFLVRPEFPMAAWLRHEKPLRVMIAADLAPSTEPAIEWTEHLPQHGPCEFLVTHLSWPPEEYERLAIDAPMHLDRTHPLVADVIRRELAGAAARLERVGKTQVIVESNMGSTAAAIAQVASREHADLLVVGRGCEEGRGWWDQSVSRAVIRSASMSVVCVPEVAYEARLPEPKIRKILAATDFSKPGNLAVAYALSVVPEGGEVIIVHVLDARDVDAKGEEKARRREQLERLTQDAKAKAKFDYEVLNGDEPARIITATAERHCVDMICVGSRGRSGLTKALLGSVSQGVLLRSNRPVLIVHAAGITSLTKGCD